MIKLQATLTDMQKVISTDNATVTGILIAVCLALGITIVYLYKEIKSLNKEHMNELRRFNELILKANDNMHEFVNNMAKFK